MVNEQLVSFVKQGLDKGISKSDLKKVLIQKGWDANDVNAALDSASVVQKPVEVGSMAKPSLGAEKPIYAKLGFWIGILAIFIVLVVSLFLFSFLDKVPEIDTGCTYDSECGSGYECSRGSCVYVGYDDSGDDDIYQDDTTSDEWDFDDGSEDTTTDTTQDTGDEVIVEVVECSYNEDCDEGGGYCLDGTCYDCENDTYCDEGLFCFNYSCVECNESVACDTGYCSEDYECVECLGDTNCTDGYLCEDAVCVEDLTCETDSDCNSGYVCSNGECTLDTSSTAVVSCSTIDVVSGDIFGGADLTDSYLVYSLFDDVDYELYLYDIAAQSVTQITDNELMDVGGNIFGDYIIWTGSDGTDMEVYMYTISTGSTVQLTDDEVDQRYASMDNDIVVWLQDEGSYVDVYAYNITSEESIYVQKTESFTRVKVDWPHVVALTSTDVAYKFDFTETVFGESSFRYNYAEIADNVYQASLNIYENLSVYSTNDGLDSYDVYLHNVSTLNKHGRKYFTDADEVWPALNSVWLAWSAYEYGDYEIYLYDLVNDEYTRLTDNEVDDSYVMFSDNFVAWYEGEIRDYTLKLYNPSCLSCTSDSECSGICLDGLCDYTDCDYDGVCEYSVMYEDAYSCTDCSCGDGVCDGTETTSSCIVDCAEPACSNGRDDDGDGLTDYPADPGCTSLEDGSESGANLGASCISDEGCRSGACLDGVCVECEFAVVTCDIGVCSGDGLCVECVDADGGEDVTVKSTTSGVERIEGRPEVSYDDVCLEDDTVTEYYCGSQGVVESVDLDCNAGNKCLEGACVAEDYCGSNDDCDNGWWCNANQCTAYTCNDGVDNDENGFADMYGACNRQGEWRSCAGLGVDVSGETSYANGIANKCESLCGSESYVSSDDYCTSIGDAESPIDLDGGLVLGPGANDLDFGRISGDDFNFNLIGGTLSCEVDTDCSSNAACGMGECLSCVETDGGSSIYTKGSIQGVEREDGFTAVYLSSSDVCSDGVLNEYYCEQVEGNTFVKMSKVQCENGCESGACKMDGGLAGLDESVIEKGITLQRFAPGEEENKFVSFFKNIWTYLFISETPYLSEEHSP